MQSGDTLATFNGTDDRVPSSSGLVGERFLQVLLADGEMGLLALDQIGGVMALAPAQLLPVPQMRAEVMGIYEWRGQPIWVVDLGCMVGLPPLIHRSGPAGSGSVTVLALRSQGGDNGGAAVAVAQVGEIETVDPDQIQTPTPGIFNPQLQALLRGYLPRSGLPVLEVEWILEALRSVSSSTA